MPKNLILPLSWNPSSRFHPKDCTLKKITWTLKMVVNYVDF